MKLLDVFRIALRMFTTNILRSLLTVFGIGIAISFIVILIGLGYGVQNITIGSIVESKTLLSLDILPDSQNQIALTEAVIKKMQVMPGMDKISPVVSTTGQMQLGDKLSVVSVTGVNAAYKDMEGLEIGKGRMFTDSSNEIIASNAVATLFDVKPAELLDKTVTIHYADPNNRNVTKNIAELKIVGLVDKVDAPSIYAPYSLFTKDGPVKIDQLKATAKDRNAVVSLSTALVKQGYQVDSLVETLDQAKTIFKWVTVGLAIFGTISLIVAAIGMFNTLTIALLERTREIGIMKAIGVTDRAVQELFLAEAAMIGFLGGVAGLAIGLGFDQAVVFTISQLAKHFNGTQLKLFQYPPFFLLSMLLYPMVLAVMTGMYPAIRAAKLNPLKALRYE